MISEGESEVADVRLMRSWLSGGGERYVKVCGL